MTRNITLNVERTQVRQRNFRMVHQRERESTRLSHLETKEADVRGRYKNIINSWKRLRRSRVFTHPRSWHKNRSSHQATETAGRFNYSCTRVRRHISFFPFIVKRPENRSTRGCKWSVGKASLSHDYSIARRGRD